MAIYEVSNLGRIKSLHTYNRLIPGRIKKQHCQPLPSGKPGYYRISLSRGGIKRSVLVHSVVAAAFIGPCPEGMEVNHKDTRDPATMKSNNRSNNLEYVTSEENKQHAKKNGLLATGERRGFSVHPDKIRSGESHPNARITRAQAEAIRIDARPTVVVAAEYGITSGHVRLIKRGRRWGKL